MDNEKTIEYLKQQKGFTRDMPTTEMNRHLDIAIAALEKQTPKLPTYKVHEKYPTLGKNYYCDCGVMFGDFERNGTNYCGNCGQRLKKSEE